MPWIGLIIVAGIVVGYAVFWNAYVRWRLRDRD